MNDILKGEMEAKNKFFIGLTEIIREKFWKFESSSNLDENNFEIKQFLILGKERKQKQTNDNGQ